MFETPQLRYKIATNTMDARYQSIHGNRYFQVFVNKELCVKGYPIQKKSECDEALSKFIHDLGAPGEMTTDGSKEKTSRNSKFQKLFKKHDIPYRVCEPERPNNNPAERCIREVRKRWCFWMFRMNCPEQLLEYGYKHVSEIIVWTASNAGKLNGLTPLQFVTGGTVNISEYLYFDFYDRFWFKQDAGVGETKIIRWLGISYGYGSLMNYWVLPESEIPVSRTTVQRITKVKRVLEVNKDKSKIFYMKVSDKFKNRKLWADGYLRPEDWKELAGNDEAFAKEFEKVFDNPDISDSKDFSLDTFYGYVNMEISMDRGG